MHLEPKRADTYIDRAIAYREEREYEKAIDDLTEAIRLAPANGTAYLQRGKIYRAKKILEKAEKDLEQAKRLGAKDHCHEEELGRHLNLGASK